MGKNTIRSFTAIGVLFCLLWLIGLGWAVGQYYADKPDNVPMTKTASKKVENNKGLTIVALGDSLTRGTGDET